MNIISTVTYEQDLTIAPMVCSASLPMNGTVVCTSISNTKKNGTHQLRKYFALLCKAILLFAINSGRVATAV